ncbi:MAG TPA: hypothetical protein VHX20_02685 [Terracidiphilus sp.]|jgi:hypothetical protein|nr:hypothetical protein [Terracidiphilus sp.]
MLKVGDKVAVHFPDQRFYAEGEIVAVAKNDSDEVVYKVPAIVSDQSYAWIDAKRVYKIE